MTDNENKGTTPSNGTAAPAASQPGFPDGFESSPERAHIEGAQNALQAGKLADAETHLSALDPFERLPPGPRALAHTMRGVVLHAKGNPDGAANEWLSVTKLVEHVPGQAAAAHFNLGVMAEASKRRDEAKAHWLKTTELAQSAPPVAAAAHFNLGLTAEAERQLEQARHHFTRTTELGTNAPDQAAKAHLSLGDIAMAMDKPTDAVAHWKKVTELGQFSPDAAAKAHAKLGLMAFQAQNREVAKAHWQFATRIVPETPVHFNLGLLAFAAGAREEAKSHWQNALKYAQVDPVQAAKSHLNLGDLAREEGKIADARKHLKEAGELAWATLRKAPHAPASVELTEVLRKSGMAEAHLTAATGDIEKARTRASDIVEDLEDVLDFFGKALNLDDPPLDTLVTSIEKTNPVARRLLSRSLAATLRELIRARVDTFFLVEDPPSRADLESQVRTESGFIDKLVELEPSVAGPKLDVAALLDLVDRRAIEIEKATAQA